MANTKQSKKRARQNPVRELRNKSRRSEMRTMIKRTLKAIHSGNRESALAEFLKTTKELDRLANKNVIHSNRASRLKSRLHVKLNKMAA